ncbi:MAG TPA: hypothetical protein PLB97_01375 [Accumulibacter sp.]|jgi:hypothetical protein|nr:hypothetical protein [Accumulibacter sp.]HPP48017.1 hypothetical protein [Accumulibacter sp.]
MAVVFGDDQMRVRTQRATHHLAVVLRQFVLNLLRIATLRRKRALNVQRLVAATSDHLRAALLDQI